MSPIAIEFMLACYYSPSQWDIIAERGDSRWNSEAGKKTRAWLISEDLVNEDYRPTERGKAWVNYICATPLPVQTWVLPERAQRKASDVSEPVNS